MAVVAAEAAREHVFDVEDVEYLRHGDAPLLARLYRPRGAGPFPMVLDVHGGAWVHGDRLNDTAMNEAMARAGLLVAALDFRVPPQAGYPASVQDIVHAVRWMKAKAAALNGRAGKVGAVGLSSGGHLAALAALRHDDPRYAAIRRPETEGHDARLACAVLCWPVIDPIGRYRVALELKASGRPYPEAIDRVLPAHRQYWPDEAAMAEGAPATKLENGEPCDLPPLLYLQGAADIVHPRPHLDRFVQAYRARGGELELALYDGEVEGFIVRKAGTPNATAAQQRIVCFLHDRLR